MVRAEAHARRRGGGPEKMREMMSQRQRDLDCQDELQWLFSERAKMDSVIEARAVLDVAACETDGVLMHRTGRDGMVRDGT